MNLVASMRGINVVDIGTLMQQLNLEVHQNTQVAHLSGGVKRKLSIAMSLLGDAKLIILDEPTANIDYHAKKHIWDLILSLKTQQRAILITTQDVEEAEIIGDKICFLKDGKTEALGTL